MNATPNSPVGTLGYEPVAVGPGGYRVADRPDLFQLELVPRPSWGKLPAVVAVWLGATVVGIVLWWLDHSLDLPGHPSGKTAAVIISLPFSALFVTALIVRPDVQRLSVTIDREAVTIVRTMLGGPDRQRIALADLTYVGTDPAEPNTILFVTPRGGARFPVARKVPVVAEMCQLIRDRLDRNDRTETTPEQS